HRLRAGNSLAGASMIDVTQRPPGSRAAKRRGHSAGWLFDEEAFASGVSAAVGVRVAIAGEADESAAIVRRKEREIARLAGGSGPLGTWRALADAWCAAWFWP